MNDSDRQAAIQSYIEEVAKELASGEATEHSYRPALKNLLSKLDDSIEAINEPKQSEHGAPDFVIIGKDNKDIKLGYGEAKIPGENLDKIEKSEQMDRYKGYANLFLTDCFDWRFYRNGEKIFEIRVGEVSRTATQPSALYTQNYTRLADEIANFLNQTPESIKSGRRLSEIMGGKARRIRDNVAQYLKEDDDKSLELRKMYGMMKQMLVHDLSEAKFADMYAQTLVYGLFVARYGDTTPDNFTRAEARDLVPASNPFLRHFFDHIVGPNFDTRLGYIVDELCEVFSVSNVQEIVHKHLRIQDDSSDAKDPIIHFYEDFLQQYDPAERKKMGAYYTPTPVVKYIVRQVDRILREDFGLAKGLASTDTVQYQVEVGQDLRADKRTRAMTTQTITVPRVQILDPAVGTATFLNETIKFIHKEFEGQEGRWPSYVNDNLLKRLHGFELMMAPYTIAHLKLGMTLKETGVDKLTERLGVYLTNTLEEGVPTQGDMFTLFGLAEAVADESRLAAEVKSERPVMVVMGNPPYSGESSNKIVALEKRINQKYLYRDGVRLDEKGKKNWLQDDYVKFISFAEDMIDKNGSGIVAMITNNGYIDNPTFRNMRRRLRKTFDEIRIVDLHGNLNKGEKTPDGKPDSNVFDIGQGVAIMIAIKTNRNSDELGKVYYDEIYSANRSDKFSYLSSDKAELTEVEPETKMQYFRPSSKGAAGYSELIGVNELFQVWGNGVITSRDKFVIDGDRTILEKRILDFLDNGLSNDDIRLRYGLRDNSMWSLDRARRNIVRPIDPLKFREIQYRPFDTRYIYYDKDVVMNLRLPVMIHYMNSDDNEGLLVSRMTKADEFAHVFASQGLSEAIFLSPFSGTNAFNFPLFLYHEDGTRTPNFAPAELSALTRQLTKPYEPEDILDYIYAVLNSPSYREKYKEFLKTDFPRVPVPTQADFDRLVPLGRELRELHLMKSSTVDDYTTTFPVAGDGVVDKLRYEDGKVWINSTQYFGNVPEIAWNFYIGGYQPAQKWLKDRKGRELTSEDLDHYQRIIKILLETDRIMKQIG